MKESHQAQAVTEARWPVNLEILTSILSLLDQQHLTDGKYVSLLQYADTHWHPHLVVENALGDLDQHITHSAKRSCDQQIYVCKQRRIKGLFWEQFKLYHFPSDVQDLSISISSMLDDEKVILVPDPDHPNRII